MSSAKGSTKVSRAVARVSAAVKEAVADFVALIDCQATATEEAESYQDGTARLWIGAALRDRVSAATADDFGRTFAGEVRTLIIGCFREVSDGKGNTVLAQDDVLFAKYTDYMKALAAARKAKQSLPTPDREVRAILSRANVAKKTCSQAKTLYLAYLAGNADVLAWYENDASEHTINGMLAQISKAKRGESGTDGGEGEGEGDAGDPMDNMLIGLNGALRGGLKAGLDPQTIGAAVMRLMVKLHIPASDVATVAVASSKARKVAR